MNMKNFTLFSLLLCCFSTTFAQTPKQQGQVITSDIDNFWIAYDKITSTSDSAQQLAYFKSLFLEKGSAGLPLIMEARRYSPQEYLNAIHKYPLFWASIRQNTYKAKGFAAEIQIGIEKLRKVYPELKPTNVYFSMGALRTNGTSLNGQILVGSELALTDKNTNSSELTTSFSHLKPYFETEPIKNVVFLNIHEYIHAQQNAIGGYDLLSQSLFEGIAEFVPVIALSMESPNACIQFGKENDERVKAAFELEMFSPWIYNWIWNDADNPFKIRDLGYYIGYAIADKYYKEAKDKKQAIKDLIELDFTNQQKIEGFVEKTGYFSKSIPKLKRDFEKSRPKVRNIQEFKNGSKKVSPTLTEITIHFSEEMDKRFRSTNFGELGEAYFPEIISASPSENGKSITYKVKLKPNQKYQLVIESGFRTPNAIPLKPYKIEFTTTK